MSGGTKYQWFRCYSEIIDDEKMRLLAFEDRWHFVALLCCKASGMIDEAGPLMRRKVAVKLGLAVADLDGIAARLESAGLADAATLQPSMHVVHKSSADIRPSAQVWSRIRASIFKRDDYTCTYCGARGVRLECDHVVPVSRGGGHEDCNLVTSCLPCNRSKRDKLLSEWMAA